MSERTHIFLFLILLALACASFVFYYHNGLGLAYNDARSHLDIGRRVVEGLKPGIAQIGSVWLPLPHLLMLPTIWNDFMWHSGLSGALPSMISFMAIGLLIYRYLKRLDVGWLGAVVGVFVFAANVNILYLQSTAMTELLLLATMTAGCYYLLIWEQKKNVIDIVKGAFFIMLSSLVRYDGWFLVFFAAFLVLVNTFRKRGYKETEGTTILYITLAAVGIFLWFAWNLLIFGDPLYFITGPFSARAQQILLEEAGQLPTKGNLLLSAQLFIYSMFYNSYTSTVIIAGVGLVAMLLDKKLKTEIKIISLSLFAPLLFNIIALYFGQSVIFVQGVAGASTWFNIRYGIMLAPTVAIMCGYLVHKLKDLRWVIIGLLAMTAFFAFVNTDSVALDDARVGSSQKNVSEVAGWLYENTKDKPGFIFISVASHDAILFSSKLPMTKYIHEGTGLYWENAIEFPDRWARWIVLRTDDLNDLAFRSLQEESPNWREKYILVDHYPFADIYELKEEYVKDINTTPNLGPQR